uniref:DNA damage-binding protein 1 n=1 Tax=Ciona savignyi TaxID=51511 RepID=H2ZPL8_CIOSA
MFLYGLTLQRSSSITHAVHGNFSGTKQQEIAVSRGKLLELLKPDPNTGKVHILITVEVFGEIRSLMAFRLTGGNKDYVVCGSDSGKIAILEYIPNKNKFEKIHLETFGKSGCRRIVPGQFLAIDPKGRAVMIGAIEKQKLVYILNRDSQARLTISSPLEAHKANTFVYHMVGIDVGFENPMFACLELDYEEADILTFNLNTDISREILYLLQTLTFYELDLGLNHVVRKYSEPLEDRANHLISVPGGNDGPGGVLVCAENYITYKNFGDQPDIRTPIPRRRQNDLDDPERGMLVVCSATHKTKSMYFFLLQTEQGDMFKVTLETDEDMVTEIRLKYFDTVPIATAMCVLRTGFLFVAAEMGNHCLYQIAHLGDDDDETEFSSAMPLEEGDTFFYAPRALRNLVLVDELDSLSPIMACQISDLANEDTPQLYVTCGRGPRSSLRILRHGLEVSEMAVSELPGNPNAVWTVKIREDEEYDSYIIVSFVNATLVLSIGETVEEVTDSGFLGTTPTLSCSLLGENALVQVYPDGIRHIRADKRVNEWKTPGKKTILKCAVNQRQVVIALTGGELVYFEMDQTGQLNEYTERKEMNSEVVCMDLSKVPPAEQRTRFLAVGLADNTVRIISLDPTDCLQPLSMQALPATPESVCIIEIGGGEDETGAQKASGGLVLNIGLQNGVLLRTTLDSVTGDLSDTRTRYLGTRAVKLFRVQTQCPFTTLFIVFLLQGSDAVLAMSSRTWLSYQHQNRFHLTPLSYESLEFASGFASEQCPEGIVAISANTLRILALEKLGTVFNQASTSLQYTPRRFAVHPDSGNLIILETDHNTYTEETKENRKQQMAEVGIILLESLPEDKFGSSKAGPGMWSSQIRIVNPQSGETVQKIYLEQNEAAVSIALCKFASHGETIFVLVGVACELLINPRQARGGGEIHTYSINEEGTKLELVHKTVVDEVPSAICPYQGRVLIGVGKLLRIYDLGKKKMLRKCENKYIPNYIASIQAIGHRIIVCDVQESVHWVRYRRHENQLVVFADDTYPRWVTSATVLDWNSVAVADKFGNITVVRASNSSLFSQCEVLCMYHIGETVLSLQKTTLIPGGSEAIVYTTVSGGIGMLVPFTSHEDHDFFQHLEMHMRNESPPLLGRDHLAYRSYYFPVKNVIDGDLCELFNSMEGSKQKSIAEELDRVPSEVSKKLEDIRTRYA